MRKIPKDCYLKLAVFLAHHHSGQWSRGYRLLCRLRARWTSSFEREAERSEIYHHLVAHYAGRV
jgi:hypothetical protein